MDPVVPSVVNLLTDDAAYLSDIVLRCGVVEFRGCAMDMHRNSDMLRNMLTLDCAVYDEARRRVFNLTMPAECNLEAIGDALSFIHGADLPSDDDRVTAMAKALDWLGASFEQRLAWKSLVTRIVDRLKILASTLDPCDALDRVLDAMPASWAHVESFNIAPSFRTLVMFILDSTASPESVLDISYRAFNDPRVDDCFFFGAACSKVSLISKLNWAEAALEEAVEVSRLCAFLVTIIPPILVAYLLATSKQLTAAMYDGMKRHMDISDLRCLACFSDVVDPDVLDLATNLNTSLSMHEIDAFEGKNIRSYHAILPSRTGKKYATLNTEGAGPTITASKGDVTLRWKTCREVHLFTCTEYAGKLHHRHEPMLGGGLIREVHLDIGIPVDMDMDLNYPCPHLAGVHYILAIEA